MRWYCRYHGLIDKEVCPVCHNSTPFVWKVIDEAFVVSDGPILIKYVGKQDRVIVPSNVIGMSPEAFKDNSYVREVVLPNRIYSIKDYAFSNCSFLSKIDLPSELETIGRRAFSNCPSLKSITIPKNVVDIHSEAFDGTPIKTITFQNVKAKWKITRSISLKGVVVHCLDGDLVIDY